MILSLTIATLAAVIGSSLQRLNTKADKKGETISPEEGKREALIKNIRISSNEKEAYVHLLEAIYDAKDIKMVDKSVQEIKSEYYRLEILNGTEEHSYIFTLIKERFEQHCKSEKKECDFSILDALREYIEFLLLKKDNNKLAEHYSKQPLFDSIVAPHERIGVDPEEITEKFKKIIDADKAIEKYGLSSHPYCYYDLLNDSGFVYNELVNLNKKIGFLTNQKLFNDLMINEIAETILVNTDFYFCKGLTASVLAKDMKAHFIHYIHHHQPEIEGNQDLKYLVDELYRSYFENRKIRNYYYFLILGARFAETLKTNWRKEKIFKEIDINNQTEFNRRAKEEFFKIIKRQEYTYLAGMSDDEIWSHVLATKAENKKYSTSSNE